ncbi:MAG: hypothetical protein NWF14_01685, partial [Candidatus Bathyarchaeota archaeon]|nr:hypothetical protein [Candidatus Bathyarchaeota archaeon]
MEAEDSRIILSNFHLVSRKSSHIEGRMELMGGTGTSLAPIAIYNTTEGRCCIYIYRLDLILVGIGRFLAIFLLQQDCTFIIRKNDL